MIRISLACSLALASAFPLHIFAQPPDPQSPQARIAQLLKDSPGAWTPAQIVNMERLRDAALNDPYALTELRHLTDNIGPRIAGSPQAQHAVEWVADEMRALGATVAIEKTTVPH
jgi:carboxypeptidase Q